MLSNTLFCPPPSNQDSACVLPAPVESLQVVGTLSLALQVVVPFSSLVQRNLFGCIHHSLSLDLPVETPAFQFFLFRQIRTFVPLSSLLRRFTKERTHAVGHGLVEFDLSNISAFLAGSCHFVQALRRRRVHNRCAHARRIRVGHLSSRHAFVSRLALRLAHAGHGHCHADQKTSFHIAFPPVSNRNVCGGAV